MAMVNKPFPAPCSTAKAMMAEGPIAISTTAPIGCSAAASRAEITGCTRFSAPNSTRRAPTCAGPTRAAAAIAAVALAPAISRSLGRWAAIAPVTNQVAANTNERRSIAPRGAGPAVSASVALTGGGARGISSRFNGKPIKRFQGRPHEASATPAEMGLKQCRQRPAHRAGEAGDQGDPSYRTARRPAIETGKRRESRIVEAHRHPDAEDHPRRNKAHNTLCQRQQDQADGKDEIRQGKHAAATISVNHPADRWAEKGGHEQRPGEHAEHDSA